MKNFLIVLLFLTGNIHAQVPDQTISEAKAKIAVKMKDPESVREALNNSPIGDNSATQRG